MPSRARNTSSSRAHICTAGGRRPSWAHFARGRTKGRRVPFVISARHTICTTGILKLTWSTLRFVASPIAGRTRWALQARGSCVLVVAARVETSTTRHAITRARGTVQVILSALLAHVGARLCEVARQTRITVSVTNALRTSTTYSAHGPSLFRSPLCVRAGTARLTFGKSFSIGIQSRAAAFGTRAQRRSRICTGITGREYA